MNDLDDRLSGSEGGGGAGGGGAEGGEEQSEHPPEPPRLHQPGTQGGVHAARHQATHHHPNIFCKLRGAFGR